MSKIKLYIATTIDGYIAKPDGDLGWLTSLPYPEGSDYGYGEMLKSVETTIMGRATYEKLLTMVDEWPYPELKTYVVTGDINYKVNTPATFVLNSDLKRFVEELKEKSDKDIWLMGGGKLISYFMDNGLIDQMTITIVPINLGEGIRLFPDRTKVVKWKLISAEPFSTGLVNLNYEKE